MTHSRIATRRAAVLSTVVLVASLLPMVDASAQSIPSKPKSGAAAADKKKDGAEAQKLVASGVKSYESGNLDAAVSALSEGLRLGGLPSKSMAKALYVRGLAYRKQGKPALAISDLTSAVWLKGGLSETERSDAMENRVAAYREAGLGDGVTGPRPQQKSAAATKSTGSGSGWQTATLDPSSSGTTAPSPSSSSLFGFTQSDPPATSSSSGSGAGIGGFFSNIFGSSSSSAAQAPPPAASEPASPKSVAAAAVAEGWGDATKVSRSRSTETRVAAVGPVSPPAAPASPQASGKFKLQVAAVRSRADAEAVATKLRTQHAAQLQSRELVVDEAVYGNMGTFYRVRIGPYADANEPKQLCQTLKSSGFDCMVVTK